MFGLGVPELIIILVIVLIIFGAGKLPKIGEGLGKGITNFRKATKNDEIDVTPSEGENAAGEASSANTESETKQETKEG